MIHPTSKPTTEIRVQAKVLGEMKGARSNSDCFTEATATWIENELSDSNISFFTIQTRLDWTESAIGFLEVPTRWPSAPFGSRMMHCSNDWVIYDASKSWLVGINGWARKQKNEVGPRSSHHFHCHKSQLSTSIHTPKDHQLKELHLLFLVQSFFYVRWFLLGVPMP